MKSQKGVIEPYTLGFIIAIIGSIFATSMHDDTETATENVEQAQPQTSSSLSSEKIE